MKAIVCTDSSGGMMFNRRRQSRDEEVRKRISTLSAGAVLRMSPYSARQFAGELPENAVVSPDFLSEAGPDDYCFIEEKDFSPFLDQIDELIVFCWNRDYPRDAVLPVDLATWNLAAQENFAGRSHDEITQEVYCR